MGFDDYPSDMEIISHVRANPMLWQKRYRIDKKNKDTINQTYSQIGSLLSKPMTGDAVSTRWKSIRDQYSREVRKINASQSRSGARNKELYKPKWTLFKELSFLKNVIKHRRMRLTVNNRVLHEDIEIKYDPIDIITEKSQVTNTKVAEQPTVNDSFVALDNEECLSHITTSGSQSSTVHLSDHFYTKEKKDKVEEVHDIILSTAAKINSLCDTISVNLAQPKHIENNTKDDEDDSAMLVIKNFLKKVPSNKKIECMSNIMAVLSKYSSNK